MAFPASLHINVDRFWATIEASARIGVGRGRLSRLALSDSDKTMRDLFIQCAGKHSLP